MGNPGRAVCVGRENRVQRIVREMEMENRKEEGEGGSPFLSQSLLLILILTSATLWPPSKFFLPKGCLLAKGLW